MGQEFSDKPERQPPGLLFQPRRRCRAGKDRDRYGISWSVPDKFLDESLTAGIRGELFASNGDYCVEIFSEYEYSDDLHFLAGYMLFGGDRRNDLGQYDRNDHLYLGVRYSF